MHNFDGFLVKSFSIKKHICLRSRNVLSFWPNAWNLLIDEGVIPEKSPGNWIEHFQMNIFHNQG